MAQEIPNAEVADDSSSEHCPLALRVEELTSENYLSGDYEIAHWAAAVGRDPRAGPSREEPRLNFRLPVGEHLIAPGEFGAVLNLDPHYGPRIEGYATVLALIASTPNLFRVRFENERADRLRFLHAESFTNPERIIEIMRDVWVAGLAPETFDDLIPEDLRASPAAAE